MKILPLCAGALALVLLSSNASAQIKDRFGRSVDLGEGQALDAISR